MSISRLISQAAATALMMLTWSAPAGATTLLESDVPGGAFSSSWSAPTEIGHGVDLVQGTGAANAFDIFAFTDMTYGTQTVTLSFSAPSGIGYSYAAGGNILVSTTPFRWGWDGQYAGTFATSFSSPTQTVELNLGPDFTGTLYLGLYFTYGQNLGYSVSLPGNITATAPVPLPATAGLLAGALAAAGGLGSLRRKRRPAA